MSLELVFKTPDAEVRKAEAIKIADAVAADVPSIVNVIPLIEKEMKSTEQNAREAAALTFQALATQVKQAAVPFLLPLIPQMIELCGEKKSGEVRAAASGGAKAFAKVVSEYGVDFILPNILKRASESKQWQETQLCLELLSIFAETAPDQVSRAMVIIVPAVSALMWSTKKQIKDEALVCMKACCRSIENVDLEPFIPALIDAITAPEKVEECVHKLAGTTFVTTVTAAALSVIVPVLDRGFKEKKVATIRKTAVIVENMARLVADPKEVAPFMPFLEPALKKKAEEVSDPECRSRCQAAHTALLGIAEAGKEGMQQDALGASADEKEHREAVFQIVRRSLRKAGAQDKQIDGKEFEPVVSYATSIAVGLSKLGEWTPEEWSNELGPVLLSFGADIAKAAKENIRLESQRLKDESGDEVAEDQNDDAEQLCDCRFSLAYGSKILLNTARLHLKRGRRYGIIAAKSAGKTTLLRSISNGQISGFPTAEDGLKCVFVEADIQGYQAKLNVVEWILDTVGIAGITSAEVRTALTNVGFTPDMLVMPITSLSGGWKMKLALARAMIQKADILLLDEPTNHLDKLNVQWVVDYLIGPACSNVTSLIVSHDTGFLDKVATNIIHFSNALKLDSYVGNLSAFVERHPEAKAYFELGNTQLVFKFPPPGPLEGVKNKGKAVMTMQNVTFTYPGADRPQLIDVNIRVALASRVACVGANGAGKSTMIKLLTGELKPSTGIVTRHPNLRFAYVAQHAFHHIEQHLDKTPNEYIRWRFNDGTDKEEERKTTAVITPEERAIMETPFEVSYEDETGKKIKEKRVIEMLMGRRKEGKNLVYEVKFKGKSQDQNRYMDRDELIERGFKKLVEELDRKKLAQEGTYVRTLTQLNVQQHLEAVGLDAELGSHNRIRSLSGGQKVKVVLGAATWAQPHIIILDEPTNYLDREALGALGNAIIGFDGGVVLITHNQTFAEYTCRETWVVANNRCDIQGDANWEAYEKEAIELGLDKPEVFDGAGNTVSVEAKRTPESVKPREKKTMTKSIKQKILDGAELTPFEDQCATAWQLWL